MKLQPRARETAGEFVKRCFRERPDDESAISALHHFFGFGGMQLWDAETGELTDSFEPGRKEGRHAWDRGDTNYGEPAVWSDVKALY